MIRRTSLGFLAVASPLMLLLFWVRVPGADVLFAVLVMAFPVALIAVTVAGGDRGRALGWPLLALLVLLEGCALGMLALRGRVMTAAWIGGVPAAAAIQLVGVWLAPLLLVALAYALTFDRHELREEDLDRLERLAGDGRRRP